MNQDLTISTLKAQLYGTLASGIAVGVLWLPFQKWWGVPLLDVETVPASVWVAGLGVLLIGAWIHEGIHGLTAVYHAGLEWKQIQLGIQWKTLTPYFHSKVPISVAKYRVVVLMPLVIMGVLPYGLALLTGNGWLLTFGMAFIITAFGDLLILWMMRNLSPLQSVQDHPSKVGLIVSSAA